MAPVSRVYPNACFSFRGSINSYCSSICLAASKWIASVSPPILFALTYSSPHFHFTEILRGSSHKFRCLFCHIKPEDRSISKIFLKYLYVECSQGCTMRSCTLALWPPDDWLPHRFPYHLWTWSSCCHFSQVCSITWLPQSDRSPLTAEACVL